jgi:hypothetical protein
MAGLGSIDFGGIGGAVSDIFGGMGTLAGAKAYKVSAQYSRKAAQYATENAGIAESSGRVKQLQANRQIYQVIGGQQADVAGAGFAKSGSALDLLRSSVEQGALTKALLSNQTAIEVRGYKQEAEGKLAEAASYDAQASAQKKSGIGGILGGVAKGLFAIFSDARLKHHISLLYRRPDGLGVYTFCYMAGDRYYQGVIAQEVLALYPDAVSEDENTGYMKVDYSAIQEVCVPVGHV